MHIAKLVNLQLNMMIFLFFFCSEEANVDVALKVFATDLEMKKFITFRDVEQKKIRLYDLYENLIKLKEKLTEISQLETTLNATFEDYCTSTEVMHCKRYPIHFWKSYDTEDVKSKIKDAIGHLFTKMDDNFPTFGINDKLLEKTNEEIKEKVDEIYTLENIIKYIDKWSIIFWQIQSIIDLDDEIQDIKGKAESACKKYCKIYNNLIKNNDPGIGSEDEGVGDDREGEGESEIEIKTEFEFPDWRI